MGYWLWVIGDWLLNMGGKAAYPCLYTLHPTPYVLPLHFTLLAPATTPLTFRLIASLRIVCQRQCFDADAIGRCSERYEVARVKTDGQFDRTSYVRPKGDKFGEWFEEHLK